MTYFKICSQYAFSVLGVSRCFKRRAFEFHWLRISGSWPVAVVCKLAYGSVKLIEVFCLKTSLLFSFLTYVLLACFVPLGLPFSLFYY